MAAQSDDERLQADRAEYRALPWRARMFGSSRPGLLFACSTTVAGLMVAFGVVMLIVVWSSDGPGPAIAIFAILAGLGLLLGAFGLAAWRWSKRSPDISNRAYVLQKNIRNASMRRHPAFYLIVIPILLAVDVALKINRHHHASALGFIIPGSITLIVVVVWMAWLVRRARHNTA
jgi:hypothetical protein